MEAGARKPVPVWNLRSALLMARRRWYSSLGERGVAWMRRAPQGLGPPADEAADEDVNDDDDEDVDVQVVAE